MTSFVGTAGMALFTGFLIVACGGDAAPGTAPAAPAAPPGGPVIPLSSIEIVVSKASIPAKAGETSTIEITAIDANRVALVDVPIAISADSGIISSAATKTGADGKLTATFSLGADRGNRNVTIRAASGAVSATAAIAVEGTAVALTASPSTAASATTPIQLSAAVNDAGNVALAGVTVQFETTGGVLSSPVAVTDGTGVARVTLTGVTANVMVTARAANTSAQVAVIAGSMALPPIEPAGVVINNLTVQVNPSVVGPNAAGSQANFGTLEVRVIGDVGTAVGVPVANAPVRIRIASTPPFGSLSVDTTSTPVLSNPSGLVSARFIAGAAPTGTDQVVVCASVDGVAMLPGGGVAPCNANEKPVRLTISQQPLFVRISFNNEIAKVNNNLDYEKLFSIYVTDAAGRGVSGANVSVRLLPSLPLNPPGPPFRAYFKGEREYIMGRWSYVAPIFACDNEDKNNNGVLDSGDVDLNGDGILFPGQSAAFTLENAGVTDSSGFVNLRVRHGQRFGGWATYDIEARASTAGSERSTTLSYELGIAEADITAPASPGFRVSPFGTGPCNSPS